MIRFCTIIGLLAACVANLIFTDKSSAQTGVSNWRAQIGTFRVGVVSRGSREYDLARLQPFKNALHKTLGMTVELILVEDFITLIEAQMESRIEYAVYSASAFATIWANCKCVQPLVSPSTTDGARGFRSVLITAKAEASSMADLKGKTVLLPGRHSFAGYLFPRDQFAQKDIDIEKAEWNVANRGSMENALAELIAGQGAGIFGWEYYYGEDEQAKPEIQGTMTLLGTKGRDFTSIWKSQPVFFGPHVVRADLDERAKVLLWDMLIALKRTNPKAYVAISPGQRGGFLRVTRGNYQPVIHFVRNSLNAEKARLPDLLATQ